MQLWLQNYYCSLSQQTSSSDKREEHRFSQIKLFQTFFSTLNAVVLVTTRKEVVVRWKLRIVNEFFNDHERCVGGKIKVWDSEQTERSQLPASLQSGNPCKCFESWDYFFPRFPHHFLTEGGSRRKSVFLFPDCDSQAQDNFLIRRLSCVVSLESVSLKVSSFDLFDTSLLLWLEIDRRLGSWRNVEARRQYWIHTKKL
jgi:hypothetical protein